MSTKTAAVIAAFILAASLVFAGCVTTGDEGAAQQQNGEIQPGQDADPQYPGGFQGRNYTGPRGNYSGPRGNFTGGPRNFSPELEQQLMAACAGKAQGDNCTMTTPRGETSGVCEARNATLSCMPQFANRQNASQTQPQPYAPAPAANSG